MTKKEEFMERVYKSRCTFQLDEEEVYHIGIKTLDLVREILREVGEANTAFKVADVIPSGSYYEQTKVGAPNEFDFMVVFENLSKQGSIELYPGCTPWFHKIKVVADDSSSIYHKYFAKPQSKDNKNFLGEPSTLVNDFWKQLSSIVKGKSYVVKTPKGTIEANPKIKQKLLFRYFGFYKLLPSKEPGLVPRDEIEIGVDLMPAIEYPDISCILAKQGFPSHFEQDLREVKCHIIAKSCHQKHFPESPCWFITFAAIELKTMKNMNDKHKKAYKVLKSLLIGEINYPGKCMNLSSYMLKTALMYHVHGDQECQKAHYGECINDILRYLKANLYNIHMPCFFARDMDTWGVLLETPGFNLQFTPTEKEQKLGLSVLDALLWLKFWHSATEAAEDLLNVESCNPKEWPYIEERFDRFKASVNVLLNEYYTSGKVERWKIPRKLIKVTRLTSEVFERFPFYMGELNKKYNMRENVI